MGSDRDVAEEDLLVWQDVLDEILGGRAKGHRCPYCREGELAVEQDAGKLRVECPKCRKFFEGRLGMGEY